MYQVDTFGRSIIGAWYRIHSAHTLAPGGTKCLESDAVSQMGCLVQASPCSLGEDAHDATNWDLGAGSTIALKINQILPLAACVQTFDYPLSRKLYLNTIVGWGNVIADDATYGPDELALAQCEASEAFIGPILTTNHFFNFAAGSSPNGGNPFAEDFNEPSLCPTQAPPGTTANTVAYTNNASVAVVNSGTGTTLPATGTICGNGVLEQYEDCDDGTNGATGSPNTYVPLNGGNGHEPTTDAYPCSTTCRWAGSPAPVDPGTLPCTTSTAAGTACTRSDGVTGGRCYVVTAGPTCLP